MRLSFLVIVLFVNNIAFSQYNPLNIGLDVGVGPSTIYPDKTNLGGGISFHVGGTYTHPIGAKMLFKTGLNFESKVSNTEPGYFTDSAGNITVLTMSNNYGLVNIPFLYGYSFGKTKARLNIAIGPNLGFRLGDGTINTDSHSETEDSIEIGLSAFELGLIARADLIMPFFSNISFALGVRNNLGLTSFTASDSGIKRKSNTFQIVGGILFDI